MRSGVEEALNLLLLMDLGQKNSIDSGSRLQSSNILDPHSLLGYLEKEQLDLLSMNDVNTSIIVYSIITYRFQHN